MDNDSLIILQPKVRIETPIGAIEADTGNSFLDGILVLGIVLVIYICQYLARKSYRKPTQHF
jgi:hypothetical protein